MAPSANTATRARSFPEAFSVALCGATTSCVSILYFAATPLAVCMSLSWLVSAWPTRLAVPTAAPGVVPVPVIWTIGALKPNCALGSMV
jgi:hypothetical protein